MAQSTTFFNRMVRNVRFSATFVVAIASFLFYSAPIRAQFGPPIDLGIPVADCDFCMCSQGISPLEMGGSAVRYDVRYADLGSEFSQGRSAPNPTNADERYFTNTVSFTYRIIPNLSTTLLIPYAHKTISSNDPVAGPTSLSNNGLSDISLLARYNLIADHKFGDTRILSATAGVKFANGSTTLLDQGESADPDLQLGTGTTDFMFGMGYLMGFEAWSIGANVLAGIRGPGAGSGGHVYGNNLNYDITARYRIYPDDMTDPTIFAAVGVRGEWRSHELQDGVQIDDSGGDVSYIAPGVQIFFTPTFSLDATLWIPFIHALNGDQLAETFKFLSGLQYVF